MPIYPSTPPTNRPRATMIGLGTPTAPPQTPRIPNTPNAATLTQGAGSALTVTWQVPAVDGTHSAASAFNLQSSPSGAATWTMVSGVASPYNLSGLAFGAAIDVQLQSVNVAGASAWSATSTLTTATALPNMPSPTLAQGSGSSLTVSWPPPAVDLTHNTAAGFNLRSSPSGAGTWTTVLGVTSPYTLSGLPTGAAIDVELESFNAAGNSPWSTAATLTTASTGPFAPNAPVLASVTPPPDGTTSKLAVAWTVPAVDSTHGAATGYNLRTSPTGANTWTTLSNVTNPCTLTGLTGATAIDVEVQATNAATTASSWSTTMTGTTWGTTVATGTWTAASTQVHNASVTPSGGVNIVATPAPTVPTAAAFGWSSSASTMPTTGLITATADGQTNGWGQWFNAPATAGTYYLWMMTQGAGALTTGAMVTSAITVT